MFTRSFAYIILIIRPFIDLSRSYPIGSQLILQASLFPLIVALYNSIHLSSMASPLTLPTPQAVGLKKLFDVNELHALEIIGLYNVIIFHAWLDRGQSCYLIIFLGIE